MQYSGPLTTHTPQPYEDEADDGLAMQVMSWPILAVWLILDLGLGQPAL